MPANVTTFNDGATTSVVNTYLYNKRRLLTGESQAQTGNVATWSIGYGYSTTGATASLSYPTGLAVTYAPMPWASPRRWPAPPRPSPAGSAISPMAR